MARNPGTPLAVVCALLVVGLAQLLISPLGDMVPWPRPALTFVALLGNVGGSLVILGVALRQPALVWSGAGTYAGGAFLLGASAWPAAVVGLVLLMGVVPWEVLRPRRPQRPAWPQPWRPA